MSTTVTGQELIELTQSLLGGYANSVDTAEILRIINLGKDKVWGVLKSLDEEYFVISSQSSDSAANDYFGALSTTVREYTLPKLCRDIRFIEVTSPADSARIKFEEKRLTDPDFQEARKIATEQNSPYEGDTYFYAIAGKRTFMLAQFPDSAMTLKLWFVPMQEDIDVNTVVDEFLFPFSKVIAEYAAKTIILSNQENGTLIDRFEKQWEAGVLNLAISATPRGSGAQFAEDFEG